MSLWLELAAQFPHTFYGLIGRRALGLETPVQFVNHYLSDTQAARLMQDEVVRRAMALAQVGKFALAEAELIEDDAWRDPDMTAAMQALGEAIGLPRVAFLMSLRQEETGAYRGLGREGVDAALYPLPPWTPEGGYRIDRALIYAFIRQESNFDPTAVSPSGAQGLMQLMPATASYMAGGQPFSVSPASPLRNAAYNMELGQRYITHLLEHPAISGDLFRLVVAYNGGPGNLQRWERETNFADDPLMFIESIPSLETRIFVERVFANLWLYRMRLGQVSPSLNAIAGGTWPTYIPQDGLPLADTQTARADGQQ